MGEKERPGTRCQQRRYSDLLKGYTPKVPNTGANESEAWIEFPNQVRNRLFGADTLDNLRGWVSTAR